MVRFGRHFPDFSETEKNSAFPNKCNAGTANFFRFIEVNQTLTALRDEMASQWGESSLYL
jgi:hypothetical protein